MRDIQENILRIINGHILSSRWPIFSFFVLI
jgi:hypothetical protein